MPNIIEITDFHAPELDPYARLTQNQLRNRLEPALNLPGACSAHSAVRHPVPWKNSAKMPGGWLFWRALWILPTWGPSSAVQRPSTWMPSSSTPPAVTRSAAGRCG